MKKHLETIFLTLRSTLLATLTMAIIFGPTSAMAAVNTATWDIGGAAQGPATFELISYNAGNITLIKTAFTIAGVELTDGQSLPAGTPVDFMIIVSNENINPVSNINIADELLSGQFAYVTGNMRINNTNTCADLACTQAERQALYDNAVAINDAPDADVGSYAADTPAAGDTTVSAGLAGGNGTSLDVVGATAIPTAGEDFALIFRATVQ